MKSRLMFVMLLLIATTGCVGIETFEADKPEVKDGALSETQYKLEDERTFEITESREILGKNRGARIISHMNVYNKDIENMDLNVTKEDLQNVNTSDITDLSGINPIDVIGEDEVVRRISNSSSILTEDKVRSLLNQSDITLQQYIDNNKIDLNDYINRSEIVESLSSEQIETIVKTTSGDRTGSVVYVVSTPSANIAGVELNPLTYASSDQILSQIKKQTQRDIQIGEKRSEFNVTKDNRSIIVNEYPSQVDIGADQTVNSTLLLAKNGMVTGNVLLVAGVYPDFADEQRDVSNIIESIRVIESD